MLNYGHGRYVVEYTGWVCESAVFTLRLPCTSTPPRGAGRKASYVLYVPSESEFELFGLIGLLADMHGIHVGLHNFNVCGSPLLQLASPQQQV
jgi:hypothetical protein